MNHARQALGVLGGSFDPIHLAHLLLAESARESLKLDKVLFVPAAAQPFKQGQGVTPIEHRLKMLELATADNPYFEISLVDVNRPGPHYSFEMLRLIRRAYSLSPDETYLIIGTDSLRDLPMWKHPQRVLAECQLGVAARGSVDPDLVRLEEALPGISHKLHWIREMPIIDISAENIRDRLRRGVSARYLLPAAVIDYIEQWALYQTSPRNET